MHKKLFGGFFMDDQGDLCCNMRLTAVQRETLTFIKSWIFNKMRQCNAQKVVCLI